MTLPEVVYQIATDQTFIAQILQDPETVLMAAGLTQEEIEATLTVLQSESPWEYLKSSSENTSLIQNIRDGGWPRPAFPAPPILE